MQMFLTILKMDYDKLIQVVIWIRHLFDFSYRTNFAKKYQFIVDDISLVWAIILFLIYAIKWDKWKAEFELEWLQLIFKIESQRKIVRHWNGLISLQLIARTIIMQSDVCVQALPMYFFFKLSI